MNLLLTASYTKRNVHVPTNNCLAVSLWTKKSWKLSLILSPLAKLSPKVQNSAIGRVGSEIFDDFLESLQGCLHHPSAQASLHSRTLPQLNQKSCNDAVDNSCSTLSRSLGLGWWETNLQIPNYDNYSFQTLLEENGKWELLHLLGKGCPPCQNISNISRDCGSSSWPSSRTLLATVAGNFHLARRTASLQSAWLRSEMPRMKPSNLHPPAAVPVGCHGHVHFRHPGVAVGTSARPTRLQTSHRWPMFGSLLSICNSMDLEDLTTWHKSLDNPLQMMQTDFFQEYC